MQFNKALNKILAQEGVHDVFVMDGPTSIRMELEESKNAGFGCAYENRGLVESRSRDIKVCVFSDGFLETPTEMTSVMVDKTGEIYGHDVPHAMPRSKVRDGGVWVTSTFVMYPDIIPKSELKFVVIPHGLSFLGEPEGVKDVIAYNPSRGADLYLKEAFGFQGPAKAMSTIIAMNYAE